jgi:hypothetical protein
MIHTRCKRLATKAEAGKWFNVKPDAPANIVQFSATAND